MILRDRKITFTCLHHAPCNSLTRVQFWSPHILKKKKKTQTFRGKSDINKVFPLNYNAS